MGKSLALICVNCGSGALTKLFMRWGFGGKVSDGRAAAVGTLLSSNILKKRLQLWFSDTGTVLECWMW